MCVFSEVRNIIPYSVTAGRFSLFHRRWHDHKMYVQLKWIKILCLCYVIFHSSQRYCHHI